MDHLSSVHKALNSIPGLTMERGFYEGKPHSRLAGELGWGEVSFGHGVGGWNGRQTIGVGVGVVSSLCFVPS